MATDPRRPTGPLAGVRVVDARRSSPARTRRCSSPTSAPTSSRSSRPRATRRAAGARRGSGRAEDGTRTAAYYLAVNRNKRSLRLDLKQPAGADVLRRLLADADVFVENLRPDSLARLGFDDAALAAINPRLIHLAISGYGPTGPLVGRPGYDFVIQAEAGLMSITGAADADGGGPTKVGVAISDVVTGLHAAVGILAGARRPRASLVRPPTGPASASTCRSSNRRWRCSSTRPRTRSSTASPRAGSATPTRTSSRTRRSKRPTARSPSRSAASGSGRGSAARSGCRRSPTTRGSRRTATASRTGSS